MEVRKRSKKRNEIKNLDEVRDGKEDIKGRRMRGQEERYEKKKIGMKGKKVGKVFRRRNGLKGREGKGIEKKKWIERKRKTWYKEEVD